MSDRALTTIKQTTDPELAAIRDLIHESEQTAQPLVKQDAAALAPAKAARFAQLASPQHQTDVPEPVPARQPVGQQIRHVLAIVWARVKTYRPDRKKVLLTSLVLLLLLQPGFVLGWALFGLVIVLGVYFALGGDAFWRRVVSGFQVWERKQPEPARKAKLRAFAFSKKWDRFLRHLPDGLADCLQLPELRGLIAADAKHDAALAERFNRLTEDAGQPRRF